MCGVVVGALIACNSGVYAGSEYKHPAYTDEEMQERTVHIKQIKSEKITPVIEELKKIDDKYDFENIPRDYFGAVSYQAKQISRDV